MCESILVHKGAFAKSITFFFLQVSKILAKSTLSVDIALLEGKSTDTSSVTPMLGD